ncbi:MULTISPECIES: transporter substrate-binding protein [unclassified Rhizobium]|uniref:transporter substrate-binding protein n=1 Tax=unclassified Rhizobium TaxID=2613769 RepID=UPI0007152E3A|nr:MULTISPECIES: transporter substrate-binding protein [unclassified Rhizobium]KQS88186.1 amidase [Rhizobium sp. Leaf391]KQT00683.1 amidase [Rhizobium sp. Leaf386]KQU09156.1 amidase [Rhizobium sp. Leaf453]
MRDTAKIGILYSTTGPYGALGRDGWAGAECALHDWQAAGGEGVELVFVDAHADLSAYLEGARSLIKDHGCRNIVGTITSSARKEVIPLVEKHDGLLWYMCPYEGFEANENVIYIAGCPNQHLIPLLDYLIPRHGNRPYLLGANYVWGWETNRLARELITKAGGQILGERYLPLEETAVERIIADIAEKRPSFILNNLIGPSSYAFLAALRRLGEQDPAFLPENCPVASCDLTECELSDIEKGVAVGQLCALPYFDSLDTVENRAFKKRVQAWRPEITHISSIFASAYAAVTLCIAAIQSCGSDDPMAIRREATSHTWPSVLGNLDIDPATNHSALPFHLGRINAEGGFDVIASRPAIVADPYLTGERARPAPSLRVVS